MTIYLFYIISNLYLFHPDYVEPIFELVKREIVNNNFSLFLDYFEKQYIKK